MKTTATVGGSGTAGLAQKLAQIRKKYQQSSQVLVGVPAAAGSNNGEKIVDYARANEFGTATIPERSFLRVPLYSAQASIAKDFERLMKMVAEGKLTMAQALDQIGQVAAGISQGAISDGISPANAPSTMRVKGSSKPLIDTGRLRQSITWVVIPGGES